MSQSRKARGRPRTYGACRCGCGQQVRGWLADYVSGHRPPRPLAERLWAKVARGRSDECWDWQGSTNWAGYGQIGDEGGSRRNIGAHRAAWQVTNGPIPAGRHVCHHCDNPRCCNPSHLFLGTSNENMQDASAKGRLPGRPKLTSDEVADIRRRYVRRFTTGRGGTRSNARELAAEYGLSRDYVSALANGRERVK